MEGGSGADPYDALNSRRYLIQELQRHVEIFKRHRRPFALLIVTFDNLQRVKGVFGDAGSDSLLQLAVTLMENNLRDIDIVSRLGEDEFAVIMPETEKQAAQAAGTRITGAVNKTSLMLDDTSVSLRVGFGVASCPEDGEVGQTILHVAVARAAAGASSTETPLDH